MKQLSKIFLTMSLSIFVHECRKINMQGHEDICDYISSCTFSSLNCFHTLTFLQPLVSSWNLSKHLDYFAYNITCSLKKNITNELKNNHFYYTRKFVHFSFSFAMAIVSQAIGKYFLRHASEENCFHILMLYPIHFETVCCTMIHIYVNKKV